MEDPKKFAYPRQPDRPPTKSISAKISARDYLDIRDFCRRNRLKLCRFLEQAIAEKLGKNRGSEKV